MPLPVIDSGYFHKRNWKNRVAGLQIQPEIKDAEGRLYRLSDADTEDEHGNIEISGARRGTTLDGRRVVFHGLLYIEVTAERPVIGDCGEIEKVVYDKS